MFTDSKQTYQKNPVNLMQNNLEMAQQEAQLLSQLNDDQFMKYILNNGHQTEMNYLVPNKRFKAYTITERCWHHQKISAKQRYSISNVFIYTLYQVKYSDALNASI